MVGKGAPDRGGIPTFLETLLGSRLARDHDVRFLNVAHSDTPEGGRATLGNVRRTVRDTVAVWRQAKGCDIVHIHSALAPAVTVVRASLLALAGRARGCSVAVHAHGGNIELADDAVAAAAAAAGHAPGEPRHRRVDGRRAVPPPASCPRAG